MLTLALPGAVADASPDYELRAMDGQLHRASDYRGRWLIINFWATWCPPCIEEMPELEKFYRANRQRAQVWGVSFEDSEREKILEFVKRLGISYPILGYGQDPLTGYGQVTVLPKVLPTTFVIDKNGLFHRRFEGPITARDLLSAIEVES